MEVQQRARHQLGDAAALVRRRRRRRRANGRANAPLTSCDVGVAEQRPEQAARWRSVGSSVSVSRKATTSPRSARSARHIASPLPARAELGQQLVLLERRRAPARAAIAAVPSAEPASTTSTSSTRPASRERADRLRRARRRSCPRPPGRARRRSPIVRRLAAEQRREVEVAGASVAPRAPAARRQVARETARARPPARAEVRTRTSAVRVDRRRRRGERALERLVLERRRSGRGRRRAGRRRR